MQVLLIGFTIRICKYENSLWCKVPTDILYPGSNQRSITYTNHALNNMTKALIQDFSYFEVFDTCKACI